MGDYYNESYKGKMMRGGLDLSGSNETSARITPVTTLYNAAEQYTHHVTKAVNCYQHYAHHVTKAVNAR
jgi:hypothetical protein